MPIMTYFQMHRWVYLMLAGEARGKPWTIECAVSGTVCDWRSETAVPSGDYKLVLNGMSLEVPSEEPFED